jgi:hypothetical protein
MAIAAIRHLCSLRSGRPPSLYFLAQFDQVLRINFRPPASTGRIPYCAPDLSPARKPAPAPPPNSCHLGSSQAGDGYDASTIPDSVRKRACAGLTGVASDDAG